MYKWWYYDSLYRLDYSQLNGTTNLDLQYKANGNIDYKSDAAWYWYNATKVHAVEGTTGWRQLELPVCWSDCRGNEPAALRSEVLERDGHRTTRVSEEIPEE